MAQTAEDEAVLPGRLVFGCDGETRKVVEDGVGGDVRFEPGETGAEAVSADRRRLTVSRVSGARKTRA
jgi:hypothetical protein